MNFWEKLTSEQNEDNQRKEFYKKYQSTYMWMKRKEKPPIIVFFTGNDDNGLYTFVHKGSNIKVAHETDVEIFSYFPKPTLFNHHGQMYWFTRKPARQYRRGLCSDNCSITIPAEIFWNGGSKYRSKGIDEQILAELFSPTYLDIGQAITSLSEDNKTISVAISPIFGVSLHNKADNKHILWYKTWPIGEIVNDKIVVTFNELRQEVEDFVRREALAYKVV